MFSEPEEWGPEPDVVRDPTIGEPGIDALAWVQDSSVMLAVFAAERFERIAEYRREAMASPHPFRGAAPELIERSLRLELAAALQLTEHTAARLLHTAHALTERYPAALDALHGGRTTAQHAELFVELVDAVEPELRDVVIPTALELAESCPLGTFRRRLRALVDTVRSATLDQRSREALARRRVILEPSDDGMGWLLLHVPVVEARAIMNRLDGEARVFADRPDDDRTMDQLRADIACDLLIDGEVAAHPDEVRGVRATVAVTVPALSLLDDDLAASAGPASVEGVGPIPLAKARELCGVATSWMRVITHPETGVVLSVGRDLYRPPADLRRLVRWRAERCLAPGCNVPARLCHIDHQVPWSEGGRTELTNLAPLCENHHIVKHHGGWGVRQRPDGVIEWISPLGRRYLVEPERRTPTFRPPPEPPPGDPPF
ncbi:HNH endonuclease signature motif containing protein [Microbacterium sp. 10M-3C3]|jgi:hypothetical protein|uniref:HNH endonuclease signature motif containing protein n=1 Tax=Microbacterium sp. 10M-3C3 TaxID=2483401 RepID=UPI001F0C67D6|nr:HNH endonuclease signature motif containing protein [Microbacterium sp. 10M-3C3]